MAIKLEDIKNIKKILLGAHKIENKKLLRPWDDYDKLGFQTRTILAREAVKKAREIVKKNNSMVNQLRESFYKFKDENSDVSKKEGKSDKKI
jgi:hypothetical protein